jgi:hypothetical protein
VGFVYKKCEEAEQEEEMSNNAEVNTYVKKIIT